MANSGSISKSMGSYYRMRLDWTQTVNSNNTSTITTKLYLIADYNISSTATKTATTTVAGVSRSDSFSAGGSGTKLVQTETWTVTHNSDGTKSISIGFSAALGLTLSGTYYGTVSNSATVTLDPASAPPSTGTINQWVMPNDFTYTINRQDSSYSHVVELHVSYGDYSEKIGERSTSSAGTLTWSPTVAENKLINKVQRTNTTYYSANAKLLIHTYKGGTYIGSNWTGSVLVSSNEASTATVSPTSPTVSSTITVSVARASSTYIHLVELATTSSYSSGGNRLAYVQNVGTSTTFNLENYRTQIMELMGSASSVTLYIRLHTFYNSQDALSNVSTNKIRGMTTYSFTVGRDAPPTWGSTAFTYQDTVSATTTITGSNQILVQGKSTARNYFPAAGLATASSGATIASYTFTLGSVTQTWTPSTIPSYYDVPITTLTANASATLIATDSHGQVSAPKTVILTIYPYSAPTYTSISVVRDTATTTTVNFNLAGKHSPLNSNSNYVQTVKWGTTYGSYPNTMTRTLGTSGNWIGTGTTTLADDAQQTYYFEIADRFGTTTRTSAFVAKTQPIFFLDAINARVGVGKAPTLGGEGSLDVANGIYGTLRGALNLDTTHYGHVIGNPTGSTGTTPTLKLNSWQDTATLAINSNATNYSSKIGFWKQGVETGSIERYYTGDELRINSSYGMKLTATSGITMASATTFASTSAFTGAATFNGGATFSSATTFTGIPTFNTKMSNGYNLATIRGDSTTTPYLIQTKTVSVPVTTANPYGSLDITWDTAFSESPLTVVASATGASSYTYVCSIYNPSTTGCTVWVYHAHNTSWTANIRVNVLAIGKRA